MNTPINGLTNAPYTGENFGVLSSHSYPDNRFVTYKQAKQLGRQVRRGEHGISLKRVVIVKDVDLKTGKERKKKVLKYFTVFNWTQTETV